MAITYTIPTNSYADAVAGTVVNWTDYTITFPATTDFVDGQIVISTLRMAEDSSPGSVRPIIAEGFGFYQKGSDRFGNPVLAAVDCILQNPWKIATAKNTGTFTVLNVFKRDAAYPINLKSTVDIQYTTSVGGTIVSTNTGSGLSPEQDAKLTAVASNIETIKSTTDQLTFDINGKLEATCDVDLNQLESDIALLLDLNMLTIGKAVTHTPDQITIGSDEVVINITKNETNNSVSGIRAS